MRHRLSPPVSLDADERWLVRGERRLLCGLVRVKTYLAAESPRRWTRRRTEALCFADVNQANRHAKELRAGLERL